MPCLLFGSDGFTDTASNSNGLDDTSYKAYQSLRGTLALSTSAMTPVQSAAGAPYGFHTLLTELASMFTSKELAVVANVGSLVAPITRSQYQAAQAPIPSNLFSHADQQQAWQTSVAQGNSPTGWAGRAADYVAAQSMNSSQFPTFFSVAGNTLEGAGANTTPVALAPGQSLQLTGFGNTAAAAARYSALTNLLTLNTGVSLAQAANNTVSDSIADAKALAAALATGTPLKTRSRPTRWARNYTRWRRSFRCNRLSVCGARFSFARWEASILTRASSARSTPCIRN